MNHKDYLTILKLMNMRKLLVYLVACLSISFVFTSCEKEDESFDENLLIGKWKNMIPENQENVVAGKFLYVKFFNDLDPALDGYKRGYEWDESDVDITEADAQWFSWHLDKSELTQIHDQETKSVPKVYKITELTTTTLKYERTIEEVTDYFYFTKVSE